MFGASSSIRRRLQLHFKPLSLDGLTITERRFPYRVRADLQRAIETLLLGPIAVRSFCGVLHGHPYEKVNLAELLAPNFLGGAKAVPPSYEEVDIGEDHPVRCLKNGLWLLNAGGRPAAMLMSQESELTRTPSIWLQLAAPAGPDGGPMSQQFFAEMEAFVRRAPSYRGKVLSLEAPEMYSGASAGLLVHRLAPVARDQVILPAKTVELLERNVVRFAALRPQLAGMELAVKKGLLFYGPPGTGKSHTIHYLAGALPGHTVLLITAEQVALLGEYMTLARLLQPSVVVIEDADLIARDRTGMSSPCSEVMLNRLLNEMDGLQPDAEILFILTTNRPEALEAALAARPGRIDQAIEFPLPDEAGRAKLVRLYARSAGLSGDVLRTTVARTEGVSASFIKELMRRAAQFHLERDGQNRIDREDVDAALDELLFSGGSLNRALLGGRLHTAAEPH